MFKLNNKSIFVLIIFGIALAIGLLEICLNIIPAISYNKNSANQQAGKPLNKNICRILCLGDSFTYGLGAKWENSYPAHLEKILNQTNLNIFFQVENLGIPGETSEQTLSKLVKISSKDKPDIVIILSGVNDTWSFSHYLTSKMFEWTRLLNPVKLNLKFLKLLKLISYNLNTPIPPGSDIPSIIKTANLLRDKKKFNQAKAYYNQALTINAQDPLALLELGRCQKLNKQYSDAALTLEKAFVLDPENKTIQAELSDLFIQYKYIPAELSLLIRLKNEFPGNNFLTERLCYVYSILGEPYFSSNLKKRISQDKNHSLDINTLDKKELSLLQAYYEKKGYAKVLNEKPGLFWKDFWQNSRNNTTNIAKLRYKNLEKAVKLCQQKGITLIFSSYPAILIDETKSVSEKYNIPLVDHRQTFYNLLQQYPPSRFFVSEYDRHCTADGYKVIAENIAAEIIRIITRTHGHKVSKEGADGCLPVNRIQSSKIVGSDPCVDPLQNDENI